VTADNKFVLHAESKMPENKATLNNERIIVGGENNGFTSATRRLSPSVVQKYHEKSKEVNTSYIRTAIMSRASHVSYLS
jgi:hypothetical protein